MIHLTISETKNRLSELLKRVRSGETLIIMDRKMPVARVEAIMNIADHPSLAPPREKWNPKAVLSLPIARGGKGMKPLVHAVAEERDAGW
jgi:antitoxin (DNA-binding transcriptional repressor) of toxin-antitoxin stability system